MKVETAAVILAGGKSSRMGQNKALLPWQGARLVDYVAGVAKEAGIADIYVSGEAGGYSTIPDSLPHQGPVGGICSSIGRLYPAYEHVLFLPVDMPLLTPGILQILLKQESPGDARYFDGHPIPCFLRLNEQVYSYTAGIQRLLENGTRCSVQQFLNGLDSRTLYADTHVTALTNTNTPQEWSEAACESAHQ